MIPGLAMFTARAEPLATWMTGLEVAYFKVGKSLASRNVGVSCYNPGKFPHTPCAHSSMACSASCFLHVMVHVRG